MGACVYSLPCFRLKIKRGRTLSPAAGGRSRCRSRRTGRDGPRGHLQWRNSARASLSSAARPRLLRGPRRSCAPRASPWSPRARWPPGPEAEARGGGARRTDPATFHAVALSVAPRSLRLVERACPGPLTAPAPAGLERPQPAAGGLGPRGGGCRTWAASDPRDPPAAFACSLLAGSGTGPCGQEPPRSDAAQPWAPPAGDRGGRASVA